MNLPALVDVLERKWAQEPDRLRQHQQDRLPHVRRRRRLPRAAADAPLPSHRHVGLRLRRHPAGGGHRVGLRPAKGCNRSSSAPPRAANIRQIKELIHGSWGR